MHDFTLPANIKQIGSIGSGIRIYMEDYVCTFLHQYATSGGYEERLAYLIGRHMLIDNQPFLFISGAIYGMYAEKMEGYTRFSHQSAEYAEAMLEEHFPGQEVVGWMQSQPSYGTYLNQHYGAYHLRQFNKPYQVLFVMDPLERVNTFYTANPTAATPAERLAEISGYFIYYEKNVNMHEYMLTNKSIDYAKQPTFVELTPSEPEDEYPTFPTTPTTYNDYEEEFDDRNHVPDPKDAILRHKVSSAKRRGNHAEQKRASSLLSGLCAVLFVVVFVMGVGLIRSQDRIDRMEGEIRQLVTAHRNLFAQMSNPEFAPVFAEASPPVVPAYNIETPQDTLGTIAEAPYIPYIPAVVEEVPPPATVEQPPPPPPEPEPPVEPPTQVYQPVEVLIPPVPATYTIQPGDSLHAISIYFFGDIAMTSEIMALNDIEDPDMIVVGRTIALPQR